MWRRKTIQGVGGTLRNRKRRPVVNVQTPGRGLVLRDALSSDDAWCLIRCHLRDRCATIITPPQRSPAVLSGEPGVQRHAARSQWWRGIPLAKRRGGDLNPRRSETPETVFETAAFDRSATPPRARLARAFRAPDGGRRASGTIAAPERCPSGRRSATGNRVGGISRLEGSNPSLSVEGSERESGRREAGLIRCPATVARRHLGRRCGAPAALRRYGMACPAIRPHDRHACAQHPAAARVPVPCRGGPPRR